MAQSFTVANYGVHLFAGINGNTDRRAWITVTNGSTLSAVIVVMRSGATLPPNTDNNIYYPEHMLAPLLDLLRNEAPVMYVASGVESCLRTAGFEPAGEGEV